MRRISIVGSSGSGKTTVARAIAAGLDIPHMELDAVHHQPDWQPLPDDEFQQVAERFVAEPEWVVDGNYDSKGVLDIVWGRADTVIWLDLPRLVTVGRVTRRSIRRAATKEELWNGNRERWRNLVSRDPEENIVAWTWSRFEVTRSRYESRMTDPRWQHLQFIRITSQRDISRFVEQLGVTAG